MSWRLPIEYGGPAPNVKTSDILIETRVEADPVQEIPGDEQLVFTGVRGDTRVDLIALNARGIVPLPVSAAQFEALGIMSTGIGPNGIKLISATGREYALAPENISAEHARIVASMKEVQLC